MSTEAGRTTWWPCDAAEHDRELIVELGEEFGPGGPYLVRVMKDLAQQQRASGQVRTGFRILRTKTFLESTEAARTIVEFAARIGLLDDLQIDEDGRRFVCRVSGWQADQERGRAAFRKAAQRADTGDSHPDKPGQTGTNRDTSRSVTGSTPPDITREELPPLPPQGGRQRTRQPLEDRFSSWVAQHFPGADPSHVRLVADRARSTPGIESKGADALREFVQHFPNYAYLLDPVDEGSKAA